MLLFTKPTALYVFANYLFCVGASNYLQENQCPCNSSADTFPLKSAPGLEHLLCIEDTEAAKSIFSLLTPKSLNLNYRLLEDDFNDAEIGATASAKYNSRDCDVLMKIVSRDTVVQSKNERCPGVCKTIPFVLVPSYFLVAVLNSRNSFFQMCSLNLTTTYEKGRMSNYHLTLGRVLSTIAMRRLQECEENKDPLVGSWDYVPSNSTEINFLSRMNHVYRSYEHHLQELQQPKRVVYGVIIWVASAFNRQMAYDQAAVLRSQKRNLIDSHRIVGWIATEDIYSCGSYRKRCIPSYSGINDSMSNPSLLTTSPSPESICAHRRPLRALAHVMKLFDTDFLLVADDSTYVNMKMLSHGTLLSTYILQHMSVTRIAIGKQEEAMQGNYSGMGCYIMGRAVLEGLSSRVMQARTVSDSGVYHIGSQIEPLSLLDEALESVEVLCDSCAQVRPPVTVTAATNQSGQYVTADIEVRVIDICVNIMAGRGTCYHSEHSMTRCLAHAVYADTISPGCDGVTISLRAGSVLSMVMCEDAAPCDLSKALTCRKYVTNPRNPSFPPNVIH